VSASRGAYQNVTFHHCVSWYFGVSRSSGDHKRNVGGNSFGLQEDQHSSIASWVPSSVVFLSIHDVHAPIEHLLLKMGSGKKDKQNTMTHPPSAYSLLFVTPSVLTRTARIPEKQSPPQRNSVQQSPAKPKLSYQS
jgi:hypothetical protein